MTIRTLEDSLHEMEKQELGLSNKLHGKEALEESIEKMRKDIASFTEQIKVLQLISQFPRCRLGSGLCGLTGLE